MATGTLGVMTGLQCCISFGEALCFPSVGRLNFVYVYWISIHVDAIANTNATFTPWTTPSNHEASANINYAHDSHTHAHGHKGVLGKKT